ncbi:Guanine nucleotide-binding protein subunit gamma 3 [Forsythia ovata]|uniref:Guanine nucleotide-binding protein subunit gamma 3 n=1 Tax=Forsythia ovata TaxID=205694 RepID=A0ABD1P4W1_9LAMI
MKEKNIGGANIGEMGDSVGTGSVPPLPPPRPKSPPKYPDLYGKRRELAKVQILEREIGFLEPSFSLKTLASEVLNNLLIKDCKGRTAFSHTTLTPKSYSSSWGGKVRQLIAGSE